MIQEKIKEISDEVKTLEELNIRLRIKYFDAKNQHRIEIESIQSVLTKESAALLRLMPQGRKSKRDSDELSEQIRQIAVRLIDKKESLNSQ